MVKTVLIGSPLRKKNLIHLTTKRENRYKIYQTN